MSWLVVCPSTYVGLCGLLFFFFSIYFHPNLHSKYYTEDHGASEVRGVPNTQYGTTLSFDTLGDAMLYLAFMMALYTGAMLPYGRFYNALSGNSVTLLAFLITFVYFGTPRAVLTYGINLIRRSLPTKFALIKFVKTAL